MHTGTSVTYRAAGVKTDADCPPEHDEVGLGELEGPELGPQVVAVVGDEVLEQVGIHGAAEMKKKLYID